jgi:hypothetical protein
MRRVSCQHDVDTRTWALVLVVVFVGGWLSGCDSSSTCLAFSTDKNGTYRKPSLFNHAATPHRPVDNKSRKYASSSPGNMAARSMAQNDNDENSKNKFGFGQRLQSIKCLVLGAVVGSVTAAPLIAIHNALLFSVSSSGLPQTEFDIDMAAVQSALFSIVYRYSVRCDDANANLGQGVVGASVLTRTVNRIVVPTYCVAVPLNCTRFASCVYRSA